MKRKKIIILISILLLGVFLCIAYYFFYLKKIIIYDLVNIEFSGITSKDFSGIKIYGITPVNKKILIYRKNGAQDIPGCFKYIEITIPDTLLLKNTSIHTILKGKSFTYKINGLHSMILSGNTHTYILPPEVKSEERFFAKLFSTYPFKVFISVLKILFILVIAIIILILFAICIIVLINTDRRKIWIWLKIIGISVLIACTLFFGYLLFAYTMSSFITAILFIIFCVTCLRFIMKVIASIFKISGKNSKRIFISLYIFGILWFCIESALRISGINQTYNEKQGFFYVSGFLTLQNKTLKNTQLLVHPAYDSFIRQSEEFDYRVKCNNEGLRDIDHSIKKDSKEYRIICMGNSFTEGVGTPQDSTWPKLLENLLEPCTPRKISVFNAGKESSDPFFEYMLFSKRMLKYKPDMVLLALGSSDLLFYRFRGGFERFTPDGKVHYREGPLLEKFYAVSYIFRYITVNLKHKNYNNSLTPFYFMTESEYRADRTKAMQDVYQCITRFYDLSLKHKFKLAIVFYDDMYYDYGPLIEQLKTEKVIPVMDLFEYNKNIEKITKQNQPRYFWKVDNHNNSLGYLMLARGVKWNLQKMGLLDSISIKND